MNSTLMYLLRCYINNSILYIMTLNTCCKSELTVHGKSKIDEQYMTLNITLHIRPFGRQVFREFLPYAVEYDSHKYFHITYFLSSLYYLFWVMFNFFTTSKPIISSHNFLCAHGQTLHMTSVVFHSNRVSKVSVRVLLRFILYFISFLAGSGTQYVEHTLTLIWSHAGCKSI